MNLKAILAGAAICCLIMYFGACGGDTSTTSSGDSNVDGKTIFSQYCAICHGEDGKREANGAKDITTSQMPLKERIALIKSGKNLMAPFEGTLSPEQIEAAAKHSMTLK